MAMHGHLTFLTSTRHNHWALAAAMALGFLTAPLQVAAGETIAVARCTAAEPPSATAAPPVETAQRIPHSTVAHGQRNITWAWLGTPTSRYPHAALGSSVHAATLHVVLKNGPARALQLTLPAHRVFEDRQVRVVDLDGDGQDELVVVESDVSQGAALVVLGVQGDTAPKLVELARSPFIGTAMRWLNPLGFADVDGDGRQEIASVTTPHVGGLLTLYRYQPPHLVPMATRAGLTNHVYGRTEQGMALVLNDGSTPAFAIPNAQLTQLHRVVWDGQQGFTDTTAPQPLPPGLQRLRATGTTLCAELVARP